MRVKMNFLIDLTSLPVHDQLQDKVYKNFGQVTTASHYSRFHTSKCNTHLAISAKYIQTASMRIRLIDEDRARLVLEHCL